MGLAVLPVPADRKELLAVPVVMALKVKRVKLEQVDPKVKRVKLEQTDPKVKKGQKGATGLKELLAVPVVPVPVGLKARKAQLVVALPAPKDKKEQLALMVPKDKKEQLALLAHPVHKAHREEIRQVLT